MSIFIGGRWDIFSKDMVVRYCMRSVIFNCVICLLCFFLLISCESKKSDNKDLLSINIAESYEDKSVVLLSTYATAVDYIPLETGRESVLPTADLLSVQCLDNSFLVYSAIYPKRVPLLFGYDGAFKRKVGSVGRAVNEVVNVRKAFINEDTEEIIVADDDKLLFYDSAGNFKRTMDLFHNTLPFRPFCLGANCYVYLKKPNILSSSHHNDKEYLIFVDSIGRELRRRVLDIKEVKTHNVNKVDGGDRSKVAAKLFDAGGEVVMYGLNDTIYSLNDADSCTGAKYKIEYGKYSTGAYKGASLWYFDGGFIETDNFITLITLFPRSEFANIGSEYRLSNSVYDKQSKRTYTLKYDEYYEMAGFKNDIDGGMPFFPSYCKNEKMYQFVDAGKFIEMAEFSTSEKMKMVASKLTIESNPVLVVVTLR
ncbi:MAG: 6-bladed beta-propeller [Bacteroidales bacterium]|nr:6-bladed beta-propeller [Bacteroidales bacterium]